VTLTITGTGNVNAALTLANFGANSQVAITATDSITGASDTITVVKLTASTAAAGATVGATWDSNIVGTPANLTGLSGSEAINNALVALGANHIVNSDFTQASGSLPTGFTGAWGGNSGLVTGITDSVIATVGGAKAIQRVATFSSSPSGYVFDGLEVLNSTLYGIPVTPGQNIMASCAVASQNTNGLAYLCISWLDANGAYIAENDGGTVSCNINGATTDIARWPRSQWTAVVPADGTFATNVRYAAINTRFNAGTATTQTVWSARPMLSVVPTGQTVYPPYQIGPVSRLADQTAANTAANIAGQGALATQNTVNVGTQVTGTLGAGNAASGLINSNVAAGTSNRVQFSLFEKGTYGWTGGNSGGTSPSTYVNAGGPGQYIGGSITFTGTSQYLLAQSQSFQVTAGEQLAVGAYIAVTGPGTVSIDINWFNGSGGFISQTPSIGGAVSSAGSVLTQGMVTVPTNAVTGLLIIQDNSTGAGASSYSMYYPYVMGVPTGQTTFPSFTPGPNAVPGADVTSANTAANTAAVGSIPASAVSATINSGGGIAPNKVTTSSIVSGSVTGSAIANVTATQHAGLSGSGYANTATLASLAVACAGYPVNITVAVTAAMTGTIISQVFTLLRDGSVISFQIQTNPSSTTTYITFTDYAATAGSHTYSLNVVVGGSVTTSSMTYTPVSLAASTTNV
jgi:hypothetical protein